jgi:hypothetical protein
LIALYFSHSLKDSTHDASESWRILYSVLFKTNDNRIVQIAMAMHVRNRGKYAESSQTFSERNHRVCLGILTYRLWGQSIAVIYHLVNRANSMTGEVHLIRTVR